MSDVVTRLVDENKEIKEKVNGLVDENKEIKEDNKGIKETIKELVKKIEELEQKRIDDNFYFEHTYWDKISIIFDKLQLMDDLKALEDKEKQKTINRIERNSAMIMSCDLRISKLEEKINSK